MPECKTNGDCDMENNFVCKNKKCVLWYINLISNIIYE
jgi:hypothetical protein